LLRWDPAPHSDLVRTGNDLMSKGYQMMVRNRIKEPIERSFLVDFGAVSKRYQMLRFKGSTQAKSPCELFRFGCGKALKDKMVPDPVGLGRFAKLRPIRNGSLSKWVRSGSPLSGRRFLWPFDCHFSANDKEGMKPIDPQNYVACRF